VVGVSVCLFVKFVMPAKTAKPTEMPFGVVTRVCHMNHGLDGGADPQERGNFLRVRESGDPLQRHDTLS